MHVAAKQRDKRRFVGVAACLTQPPRTTQCYSHECKKIDSPLGLGETNRVELIKPATYYTLTYRSRFCQTILRCTTLSSGAYINMFNPCLYPFVARETFSMLVGVFRHILRSVC